MRIVAHAEAFDFWAAEVAHDWKRRHFQAGLSPADDIDAVRVSVFLMLTTGWLHCGVGWCRRDTRYIGSSLRFCRCCIDAIGLPVLDFGLLLSICMASPPARTMPLHEICALRRGVIDAANIRVYAISSCYFELYG